MNTVKSNIQMSLDTTNPSIIMTSRFETSFSTYITLSVSALKLSHNELIIRDIDSIDPRALDDNLVRPNAVDY